MPFVSARFPHGRSVKWPRVYEALRRRGFSKSSAAAISNAAWNRRRLRRLAGIRAARKRHAR